MLKFFRRIRQSLLSENKFSKYLIYAIGEIILVVIGILIALQINNWNEQKKLEQREATILRELHEDFKSNKEQLDSIIQFNKETIRACQKVLLLSKSIDLKKLKSDKTNFQRLDSLMYYHNLAFANKSFNPKTGTVNSLINSSTFEIIKNDSLRRYLLSWNDVLNDYLEEERFNWDFLFNEVQPWMRATYDFSNPRSEQNLRALFSPRQQNYNIVRTGSLANNIQSVEDEGILELITNIVRLTEEKSSED